MLRRQLHSCEQALEQERRRSADERARGDTAVSAARRLRRLLRAREQDLQESERRRLSRRRDSLFPLVEAPGREQIEAAELRADAASGGRRALEQEVRRLREQVDALQGRLLRLGEQGGVG